MPNRGVLPPSGTREPQGGRTDQVTAERFGLCMLRGGRERVNQNASRVRPPPALVRVVYESECVVEPLGVGTGRPSYYVVRLTV
eukprot:1534704-Prymnesium_polylepis.1